MSTIYIALIFIMIIAGLLLLIMYSTRAKKNRTRTALLKELNESAKSHGLKIADQDIFRSKLIAQDSSGKAFVFIDHSNPEPVRFLLKPEEIASCNVSLRSMKLTHEAGKKEDHINSVYLEVGFKDKHREVVKLTFYEEIKDGIFELLPMTEKAKRWKAKISNSLAGAG